MSNQQMGGGYGGPGFPAPGYQPPSGGSGFGGGAPSVSAEVKLNVRDAKTGRQYIVVGAAATRVKDLHKLIEDQYTKLFKEPFKVSFLKNGVGSVIDEDYAVHKVLFDGETVTVYSTPLAEDEGTPVPAPETLKRAAPVDAVAAAAAAVAVEDSRKMKRRKKIKDPNAPKRPPNAFFLYAQERRTKRLDSDAPNGPQFLKQLGTEWSEMSDAAKAPYIAEKDELYTKFHDAKKQYELDAPPGLLDPTPHVPAEQPKRVIKRLLAAKGWLYTERDPARLDILLAEFNEEKDSDRTRKWLIKQLEKIEEKAAEKAAE